MIGEVEMAMMLEPIAVGIFSSQGNRDWINTHPSVRSEYRMQAARLVQESVKQSKEDA
jgi:hypothetical protein